MKPLYIVVNDNGGRPSDRIEYAFLNEADADKYAEELEEQSVATSYWVETIYLYSR